MSMRSLCLLIRADSLPARFLLHSGSMPAVAVVFAVSNPILR